MHCWPAVVKRTFQDGAWFLKWPPVQQHDYTSIRSIISRLLPVKCRMKTFHSVILDLMGTKSWGTKGKRDQAPKKKLVMAPRMTIHLLCRTLLMMVLTTRKAILRVISPPITELRTERSGKGEKIMKVAASAASSFGVAVDSWRPVEGEKWNTYLKTNLPIIFVKVTWFTWDRSPNMLFFKLPLKWLTPKFSWEMYTNVSTLYLSGM